MQGERRKGRQVTVFPLGSESTVMCSHCSQITAWQNVVLFRRKRVGLLGEREERQRKDTHINELETPQGSNSLFPSIPVFRSVSETF